MVKYDILFQVYRPLALVLDCGSVNGHVDQVNPAWMRPRSGSFLRTGLEDGAAAAVGGKVIFKGNLGFSRERTAIAPG